MTPREPDRFEVIADRIVARGLDAGELADDIAAALRAVEADALERAADIAESYGCDYAAKAIRALASPAAAPAAEPAPLLPRVLAALEIVDRQGTVDVTMLIRSLAAELRAYIAEREPAEKRIAELERKAEAWADAIEYCEYSFSPEWLVDRRNRSVFAAHIFRLLDAARAATAKGEGKT